MLSNYNELLLKNVYFILFYSQHTICFQSKIDYFSLNIYFMYILNFSSYFYLIFHIFHIFIVCHNANITLFVILFYIATY